MTGRRDFGEVEGPFVTEELEPPLELPEGVEPPSKVLERLRADER